MSDDYFSSLYPPWELLVIGSCQGHQSLGYLCASSTSWFLVIWSPCRSGQWLLCALQWHASQVMNSYWRLSDSEGHVVNPRALQVSVCSPQTHKIADHTKTCLHMKRQWHFVGLILLHSILTRWAGLGLCLAFLLHHLLCWLQHVR